MKVLLNRFSFNKKKNKFKNIDGQSYIEFLIMFLPIIVIFYTVFEIFWLINAQILVTNTAKVALRQVEVYGEIKNNLVDDVKTSLSKMDNIKDVKISVNNIENPANGTKFQLREPVNLTLTAKYDLILFNDVFKTDADDRFTTIPLSATYHGVSQRLHKDMTSPVFITE